MVNIFTRAVIDLQNKHNRSCIESAISMYACIKLLFILHETKSILNLIIKILIIPNFYLKSLMAGHADPEHARYYHGYR